MNTYTPLYPNICEFEKATVKLIIVYENPSKQYRYKNQVTVITQLEGNAENVKAMKRR